MFSFDWGSEELDVFKGEPAQSQGLDVKSEDADVKKEEELVPVPGRLVEVLFSGDSFKCCTYDVTFVTKRGLFLNYDTKNETFVENNEEKGVDEEENRLNEVIGEPTFAMGDVLKIKPLENPLAFEIHTRFGTRIFLFERYSLKLKMLTLLNSLVCASTEERDVDVITKNGCDPAPVLNNDIFQFIFSHFYTIRDFKTVLLVSKEWNARFTKIVSRLTDLLIQNYYIEHQRNFSVSLAAKREQMETKYVPVLLYLYNPRHQLPLDGKFQTWKYNVAMWSGKWYYEVVFGNNINHVQMGWMACQCECRPSGFTMTGVGDDKNSWCYDPTRQVTFNEVEKNYGSPGVSSGDAFGCMFDMDKGVISFRKNGVDIGPAFENIKPNTPYYVGVTRYLKAEVSVVLHKEFMKFPPPDDYLAVGEGIAHNSLLVEAIVGKTYLTQYQNSY